MPAIAVQNAPPGHMFHLSGACIDIPLSRRDARSRTGGALTAGARSRRRGRGAQCAFLRDLAALCALNVIGSNGNLSGGDKPLEQSCDIAPDHMGRSANPTPNRYFWPKSSRTSGPAHQVVGEKAKLFRHLQTIENSVLIRVHVQNLRFFHPTGLDLALAYEGNKAWIRVTPSPPIFSNALIFPIDRSVSPSMSPVHFARVISIGVSVAHHFHSRA
jgi:hypothetical protein